MEDVKIESVQGAAAADELEDVSSEVSELASRLEELINS